MSLPSGLLLLDVIFAIIICLPTTFCGSTPGFGAFHLQTHWKNKRPWRLCNQSPRTKEVFTVAQTMQKKNVPNGAWFDDETAESGAPCHFDRDPFGLAPWLFLSPSFCPVEQVWQVWFETVCKDLRVLQSAQSKFLLHGWNQTLKTTPRKCL